MDINYYLGKAEQVYRMRLKTVVPLGDPEMDRIERAVAKFQLRDITRPKKTILQRHPLDFQIVQNAEVWIVDMTFGLPASPNVLRLDIRKALDAPEEFVVVRSSNEPIEVYTDALDAVADIEAEAARRGLTREPMLAGTDYPEGIEPDAADYYGNEYNTRLLGYLRDVAKARPERRVDPVSPLFSFLKAPAPPTGDGDFNADIKGAPPIGDAAVRASAGRRPPLRALQGSQHDAALPIKRVYRDAAGKRVVLSRTVVGGKGE